MNLKTSLIFALLCWSSPAFAQSVPAEVPFQTSEEIVYAVSYKVGFVNSDVAEVVMRVNLRERDGKPIYAIYANGKVYPFYRWFFDLNDTYHSSLDMKTLRPLELRTEISEGKYRYSSQFLYDWDSTRVKTTYRNHGRGSSGSKTMHLPERAYDALAHFYNLRCQDSGSFKSGKRETMQLVLEDTIRNIQYRFAGREVKNIKGLGKYHTLKFVCQLATSTGESFEDGNEFSIWISDDQNKIPLYIESPIRVGSIRARLLRWNNLKYDFDSRISK